MTTTSALEQTATRPTGRRRGRVGVLTVMFVAITGALLALVSPANAGTITAGSWSGNYCIGVPAYAETPGANACVRRGAYLAGSYTVVQNVAADFRVDGASARSFVTVQQFINGVWHNTGPLTTVTASHGANTSTAASPQTIYRAAGATHVRLVIQACVFDGSRGLYLSCSPATIRGTSYWWA